MMSKVIRDLKALFFISLMGFKNKFLEAVKNPLKLVVGILKILLFSSFFIVPNLLKKGGKGINQSLNVEPYIPYIGGALLILFCVITFQGIRKAVKNYLPTNFNKADINIVFTSPISKKTMYFYSFIRSFGVNLFVLAMYVITTVVIAKAFKLPLLWGNAPYMAFGLFFFMIFMQSLSFFIYSFNKKFKKEKEIKFILILCTALLLALFLRTWYYGERSLIGFLKAVGGAKFEWIPVIGWTKGLVSGLFYSSENLYIYLLLNGIIAILGAVFAVSLADDYYEDAQKLIDQIDDITASASTGDFEGMNLDKKDNYTKKVRLSYEGKGAKAFLWKEILIFIRKSENKGLRMLWNLMFPCIGGIIAFFMRSKGATDIAVTLLFIGYMYAIIAAEIKGLPYEMKHIYIYTLPGRVKDKMVWVSAVSAVKSMLQYLIFILPFIFLNSISILQLFAVYVAFCSFVLVKSCEKIIKQVVAPDGDKNSFLAYIIGIAQLLFNIPGFLFAGLTYYFTRNWTYALLLFVPGEIIAAFVMIIISERLFKKVEFR